MAKAIELQPINTAPLDTWIIAGMKVEKTKANPAGWWEATVMLHEDNDHWTDGATVLHYNGNTLVGGFKGPFTHWRRLTGPT